LYGNIGLSFNVLDAIKESKDLLFDKRLVKNFCVDKYRGMKKLEK
jgi:hypothetical protein